MKLTVLMDNNTLIDQYYLGEPALCLYIEDEGHRLLLDAGYSGAFLANAENMGVDLSAVRDIVISHGHNDHTRGLRYLDARGLLSGKRLIAHPDAFAEKTSQGAPIGSPLRLDYLRQRCELLLRKEPLQVSENIVFLGEIPQLFDFEPRRSLGQAVRNGVLADDFLMDDTALVYTGAQGLFIITGCSHSGICNIVEYAKRVCGDERLAGVMGGFHLFELSERVERTIGYLQTRNVRELYPCHCVSLAVKSAMGKHLPIHEVGVGLTLDIA